MPPSFPGRPGVRQRPPGCRSRDRNHRWRPHDRADGATAVTDDRAVVRRPLPPRRRRVRVAAADPPLPPPWRRGAPGTRALPANGPPRRRGQHPAAIRIKVARADEDLIAVVECSHANGDRSEDLLFPHPRSIAGREQTPTTLTRTPLDPRADRRGSGCRWCLPAASSSEGQARGSRRPLLGGVLTSDLYWSGWRDLNPRPLAPKASALPNCATPRCLR